MGLKASELNALAVSRLVQPGTHAVGGVSGLYLQVLPTGSRSWILRVMVGGKRREMGLGGYPSVTLALARESAREARDQIKKGIDPITEARKAKSALKAANAAAITFEEAAKSYLAAHEAGWRNPKHADQWRKTLESYAYPHLGRLLVSDIQTAQVLAVLEPIWQTKTETASRVRGRIESVLSWAAARGYRSTENPARWRGHLENLLASPKRIARPVHHRALPLHELGAFMANLRKEEGLAARALEFAILTAGRSGEIRGAKWSEIDKNAGVWIIPAARMKAHREHRVPLSDRARALLEALPTFEGQDLVFASGRGGPLSDMTLLAVMRRMGVDAVPHGFRSTFRDWAAERTSYPHHVAEMALAHAIGNKVEEAYRRGDLLEKRRRMMADWADYCDRTETPGDNVRPIGKRLAA